MPKPRRWSFPIGMVLILGAGWAATLRSEAPAEAVPGAKPETSQPELVVYATENPIRRGYLARPEGKGPFPAIVFNHGSDRDPGQLPGQIRFYTSHGYVLFVPHRRGHGRSEGRYLMDDVNAAPPEKRGSVLVERLVEQSDDVAAAVTYLAKQPFVDPFRIAVVGCSFGGIETMLAAERDLPIGAAVNFAGAAMTWGREESGPLRERMKEAARKARVPVFFLQAENDYDTAPSKELAAEMQKAGRPFRLKIFPPQGTTKEEGHAFCLGGSSPPWGSEVLGFLRETLSSPFQ